MAGTVNTSVDMANLALGHLKEPPISAFDFSSVASRWFKDHYDNYRDAYTSMHDWDFAMQLAALPVETEAPPFRWKYRYRKPADALRVPQQTVDGDPDGQLIKHEIIGQWIFTDCEPPFPFRYIRRVSVEAEFASLFVYGFSLFLAAGCAHVITGKNSRSQELRQASEEAFRRAGMVDAKQGTPLPMVELDLIADR